MYEIIKIRRLDGLAARRKSAGYTQQAFADMLGVPQPTLAAWEVGRNSPRAGILPYMADLLLCTIDDLYKAPEVEDEGQRAADVIGLYGDIIPDREEG